MKRLFLSPITIKPFNRVAIGLSLTALLAVPLLMIRMQSAQAAMIPAFVQQSSASPQSPQTTVSVSLPAAETAGDTNVLAIGFNSTTGTINSVTDSRGNTYQVGVPLARDTSESQAIYYAKKITAGSDTVTVTFNASVAFPEVRLVEYKNLDQNAPFVSGASASMTAKTVDSGAATASGPGLVFGSGTTGIAFTAAGTGFTKRAITNDDNIIEDKTITAAGSYNATATLSKSGKALMQVAIFKAAPDLVTDTTPPTVPANLVASPVSTSQINLSWSASTDAVGVTGYKVFRDGVQVATTVSTSYSDTGLGVNTSHIYTVSAFDAAGNNSAASTATTAATLPDTTAPSVPAGITATAVSSTQVNLTWNSATDNIGVVGYRVYDGGVLDGTTTGTSYQDTGLQQGMTYGFTVSAIDAAGNESAQSTVAMVTTPAPDTTAPSVPANVAATPVSTSQINLSWSASSDDVATTGYTVYRDGTQIATVGSTAYQDTGLTAGATYNYTVSAFDASGNTSQQSTPTAGATFAPDTAAPSIPTGLSVVPVSTTEIDLSWAASNDDTGVTGYTIYQNGTPIGTTTNTTYHSTGLAPSTAYSYTLSAYDAAGNNSAQSDTASATTLTPTANGCALPNYPSPSCTGVPAGTNFVNTVNGTYTVTTPGQVIDGWNIHGDLHILANDTVVRNSQIDGTVNNQGNGEDYYSFTISDSTVGPVTGCVGSPGVGESKYTATRIYVRNHDDGFRLSGTGDATVQDSYFHACYLPPSLAPPDGSHSDGVQAVCGSTACPGFTILHDTFNLGDVPATFPLNLMDQHMSNVVANDNLLIGGGNYLVSAKWSSGANWIFHNNRLVQGTWGSDTRLIAAVSGEGTCAHQDWQGNTVVTINSDFSIASTVQPVPCED